MTMSQTRLILVLVLLTAFICLVVAPVSALTVADTIAAATPGSTVTIPAGTVKEHNIVIDKPITLIGEGVTVDAEYQGSAFVVKADNVKISGITTINTATAKRFGENDIKRGKEGEPDEIVLTYAAPVAAVEVYGNNAELSGLTLTEPFIGIRSYNAKNGVVSSCDIVSAELNGIRLEYSSHDWTISSVTISGTGADAISIMGSFAFPTVNTAIYGNTITSSGVRGVTLVGVSNSQIRSNTITENGDIGVWVDYTTTGSTIRENTFENSQGKKLATSGDVHVAVPKGGSFDIGSNNMRDAPGGMAKGIFEFFGWGVIQYE